MQVSRQIELESGRKVRADWSEPSDGFWSRVELLDPRDRMLIELAVRGGRTHRQIAELLDRTPGSITRALQRLSRRLYDPLVLLLMHPNCGLEPIQRQIGVEHFLCGMHKQEIAQKHGLALARVRQILGSLKMWQGISSGARVRSAGRAGAWKKKQKQEQRSWQVHAPGSAPVGRAAGASLAHGGFNEKGTDHERVITQAPEAVSVSGCAVCLGG